MHLTVISMLSNGINQSVYIARLSCPIVIMQRLGCSVDLVIYVQLTSELQLYQCIIFTK